MRRIVFTIATAAALALHAGVYYEERATTAGSTAMLALDHRVWISGDKSRVMRRTSDAGSQATIAMAKGSVKSSMDTQLTDREMLRQFDEQVARQELAVKMYREQAEKGDRDARRQLPNEEQKLARLKEQQAEYRHKQETGQLGETTAAVKERVDTQMGQMDDAAWGQEMQKQTLEVDITRFDRGLIWRITTHDLSYREISIAQEHAKQAAAGQKTAAAAAAMKLSVEVKDLGPAEAVAGHPCNKYKVSAVINAQGYSIPYLTGEFWIAPDLQDAKGEILAYRARFAREIGPDTSGGSNPLLQQYLSPLMNEMRAAVEALPGLALKKRLAFALPTGGMPGAPPAAAAAATQDYGDEITKITPGPVDDKLFELPEGLKKTER